MPTLTDAGPYQRSLSASLALTNAHPYRRSPSPTLALIVAHPYGRSSCSLYWTVAPMWRAHEPGQGTLSCRVSKRAPCLCTSLKCTLKGRDATSHGPGCLRRL
eukprot:4566684-Prymnesium_polylepis.1